MEAIKKQLDIIKTWPVCYQIFTKLKFFYDVFSMFIWDMYPCPFPEGEEAQHVANRDGASPGHQSAKSESLQGQSSQKLPPSTLWKFLDFLFFFQLDNTCEWIRSAFGSVSPRTSISTVQNIFDKDSAKALTTSMMCLSSIPCLLRKTESFLASKQALASDANVTRFLRALKNVLQTLNDDRSYSEDVSSVVKASADLSLKSLAVGGDSAGTTNKVTRVFKQFTDRFHRYFNPYKNQLNQIDDPKWKPLNGVISIADSSTLDDILSSGAQNDITIAVSKLITSSVAEWQGDGKARNSASSVDVFTGHLVKIRRCLHCKSASSRNVVFSILELAGDLNADASNIQSLNRFLSCFLSDGSRQSHEECACSNTEGVNTSKWQNNVILSHPSPCLIMTISPSKSKQSWIPPQRLVCPCFNNASNDGSDVNFGANSAVYVLCAMVTEMTHSPEPYHTLFCQGECWWQSDGKTRKRIENIDLALRSLAMKGSVVAVCYKNSTFKD